MPPRPFPFPISIGTDIIHVKRIHDILLRAQSKPSLRERFLRRFLTPSEVREFQARFGDVSTHDQQRLSVVSRHLAGRWAAKEAAIKAVTWRRLSFHDVIIQQLRRDGPLRLVILDNGACAPRLEASGNLDGGGAGRALESNDGASATQPAADHPGKVAAEPQGQLARISISHDGDYATAVCLAAEEP